MRNDRKWKEQCNNRAYEQIKHARRNPPRKRTQKILPLQTRKNCFLVHINYNLPARFYKFCELQECAFWFWRMLDYSQRKYFIKCPNIFWNIKNIRTEKVQIFMMPV